MDIYGYYKYYRALGRSTADSQGRGEGGSYDGTSRAYGSQEDYGSTGVLFFVSVMAYMKI